MNTQTGKIIIAIGISIVIIGLIVYFLGEKLSFFGRLPGDFRVEKENFRFYFPLTSMILLSVAVNILIRIYRYFFG